MSTGANAASEGAPIQPTTNPLPESAVPPSGAAVPPIPMPEPTPPPVEGPSVVRDALSKRGLDPSTFNSDEEAVEALVGAAEAYRSAQPIIDYGQQHMHHQDQFAEYLNSQQNAPVPPQPAEPEKAPAWKWDAPAYDPNWAAEFDANGDLRQGGDPTVPGKMNHYRQWSADQTRQFLQNPQALIQRATADRFGEIEGRIDSSQQEIQQQIDQAVQQGIAGYQQQQQQMAFLEVNKEKLFLHDEQGNMQFNPQTGKPIDSPMGESLAQHLNWCRQQGMQNVDEAVRRFMEVSASQEPAVPAVPPQQAAPEQTRDTDGRFMSRVLQTQPGNRSGTLADATAPPAHRQNEEARLSEITNELMRNAGMLPQTG